MTEHDEVRTLLGAYVLGGLDPAGRAILEDHLRTCAECRGELATFAPIPGLLRRVDAPGLPEGRPDPAIPLALLAQVRAERRRRTRRSVVQSSLAAVAAAVMVLGAVAVTHDGNPGGGPNHPTAAALQAAGGSGTHGQAGYTAKPWGTAVTLDISHLASGGHFVLVALGHHGQREQAASWSATPTGRAQLAGATSIPRTELSGVLVVAKPSGTTVATARG